MDGWWRSLESLLGLGLESHDLGVSEMALRAVLVYLLALAMIRLGHRRFMGRATAFDVLVAIVLGSILSRAITGQSPFIPALAAAAILVASHWAIAALAFHVEPLARLVKGRPRVLVENGTIRWEAMRRSHVGRHDLEEALRTEGRTDDLSAVRQASLERSGKISVLTKTREPRIVELRVEQGVQTVRIELG